MFIAEITVFPLDFIQWSWPSMMVETFSGLLCHGHQLIVLEQMLRYYTNRCLGPVCMFSIPNLPFSDMWAIIIWLSTKA
jgi:hypothetical protein